ncbi:MAG TPA: phage tail protein, partial [Hyphomicrobiaceae bacterium]|nr:phage tail protein [Hyphomicrobiaceae bacterium]
IHVYAWDARPFPAFPNDTESWGDGANWRLGHWLNGRIAGVPLAELIARILAEHGFADCDADLLEGVVPGYVIDRIMSAREALQPLELAYFFDAVESASRIVFRHRGAEGALAQLTEEGLVERRNGASPLTLVRAQETELPASAKVVYIGAGNDYQQAVVEARRLAGASGRVAQADLAVVLEAEEAAAMVESWLFEAWSSRERASFTLPPSRLALEPGDVVSLEREGRSRLYRITEVGEHGERDIEALSIDPAIYARIRASDRPPRLPGPLPAGQPLAEFLDLPLLRGDEPEHAAYVAAAQSPWPGAIAFYSSPEATGYSLRALATAPAVMGTTLDPLPAGPAGRMDRATRLRVLLDGGELASVTPLQLLAGANAAAVRRGDGDWEVVQFESAVLLAPLTYELSGFLRGQAGSEAGMPALLAAGARFVLLDGAVTRIDLAAAEVGLPYTWRYGPANRDLGDAGYVERTHAFIGLGRRPLAPVHVRGTRSSGDVTLTWIRRTRMGGDSWDAAEVPLGEDSERYEIDILDGATVKRTLASSLPSVTYTAAQQTADFGSPQATLSVRIYQLGAAWGRGSAAAAVV